MFLNAKRLKIFIFLIVKLFKEKITKNIKLLVYIMSSKDYE